MTIPLTWLGHASFRLDSPGGKRIYIDPFLTGNPKCPEAELKPTRVDLIALTHGHNDHTGGGEYIQRTYNPTILMGKLDWDIVVSGAPPHMRRGVDVLDGQKLTLGDTTITLLLLPGHTPGSVSGIIPAKFRGQTINILLLTASRFSTYASMAPFQRGGPSFG